MMSPSIWCIRMRQSSIFTPYWLALSLVFASQAQCATLQVAPVMLNLSTAQRAGALYLTNTGTRDIHAQVRIYAWSQPAGKDVLTLTNEVVSSPAITALKPGQQQLVRIVVLNPVVRPQEQSFRLVVDELPGTQPSDTDHTGVHFLLRYSIPLFIAAESNRSKEEATHLTCSQQNADIWCQNKGTTHIRLSDVQAIAENGQVTDTLSGLAGYVLAGQKFMLPFKRNRQRLLSSLRAYLNEHTQASQLSVSHGAVVSVDDASR